MSKYISTIYHDSIRPQTTYPQEFAKHLYNMFGLQPGLSLLEPGCGRGDVLKSFKSLGLDVKGCDISEETLSFYKDIEIKIADIECDGLPYADESFDVVFSKSFIEHFYYPERYMKEAFRVLRPGGLLITCAPDWESNYKKYFDDYTHRTPFTIVSLRDIKRIFSFDSVKVIKLRQLPFTWNRPVLNLFLDFISPFVPVRTKSKVRWVRELLLIGSARKPLNKGKVL